MPNESANGAAERPPFDIIAPREQLLPIVFDSPHSGSYYPPEFLALTRLDERSIRRSEDSYVDELIAPSVGLGVQAVRLRRGTRRRLLPRVGHLQFE